MKKLIIAGLALAAATTMYAQGQVNMVSANAITYGDSCGALAGLNVGTENGIYGILLWNDQEVARSPFTDGKKGPTGKIKGGLIDTALFGAGTETFVLKAANDSETYLGQSNPFTYTVGSPTDPTKVADAQLVFDTFTVDYVPEPTTIALGILGLSSLLVLRRRD